MAHPLPPTSSPLNPDPSTTHSNGHSNSHNHNDKRLVAPGAANGGKIRPKTAQLLAHQFQDESGAEYEGTVFGDFRHYMEAKQVKLQNQAQVAVAAAAEVEAAGASGHGQADEGELNGGEKGKRKVFEGCVIYINGFTGRLSSEQLQHLIIQHGGVHVNHMWGGKTTVTHIVASTLTNRKRELLAGYKVVRPEWIERCVEVGRLVPWLEFRTVEAVPGQTVLNMGSGSSGTGDSGGGAKSVMPPPPAVNPREVQQKEVKQQMQKDGIPPITDPAFITHFYTHSRLHHLSMWKADLRRKYLNLAQEAAAAASSQDPTQNHGRKPAPEGAPRMLMHVDYDSFFVSVALLKHPDLTGLPVAVTSGISDSSDLASVNYVARQKYGLRNGMWMKRAKEMCPGLKVLRFDFEAYERASEQLYKALLALGVGPLYPVSVDEAVLDITDLVYEQVEDGATEEEIACVAEEKVAARLRNTIRAAAGIEASIGLGNNMLLARVALAKAKPAGHMCIRWSRRFEALDDGTVTLRDLPGVGRSVVSRLQEALGVHSIKDLREKVTRAELENVFGPRHGLRLWEVARGIDSTLLVDTVAAALERKSIGVEISWGVRAEGRADVGLFIRNLVNEVSSRMKRDCVEGYVGSCVTLKVYRAHKDAAACTAKAFGHGLCDIYSKSRNVPAHLAPTDDAGVLGDLVLALMDTMECPPLALRGVGIQVTKLEKKGARESVTTTGPSMLKFVEPRSDHIKSTTVQDTIIKTPKTPEREQQDIDWSVYAELPSTLRQIVKEEYHLPSTPAPAAAPAAGVSAAPLSANSSPTKRKRTLRPSAPSKRARALQGAGQNTLTQLYQGYNGNTSRSSNNSINRSTTGFVPSSSQNYFARPSIIDTEVLNELPESVVADIQRELKLTMQANTLAAAQAAAAVAETRAPLNAATTATTTLKLGKGLAAPVTQVLLDQDPTLADPRTQIYPALSTWIQSTTQLQGGPHPADVEVVRRYVERLARDPVYWGQATRVLRWLKRAVGEVWSENEKYLGNARREWAAAVEVWEETVVDEFGRQGVPI